MLNIRLFSCEWSDRRWKINSVFRSKWNIFYLHSQSIMVLKKTLKCFQLYCEPVLYKVQWSKVLNTLRRLIFANLVQFASNCENQSSWNFPKRLIHDIRENYSSQKLLEMRKLSGFFLDKMSMEQWTIFKF